MLGGDLMGDLMSKLTMRRKGISGAKPSPNSDEVTIESQIHISIFYTLLGGGRQGRGDGQDQWDDPTSTDNGGRFR